MKTRTENGIPVSARLINIKAVCSLTSFSRPTVYTMVRDGSFPKPVKIGRRRVAWREAAVIAWLESRPEVTLPRQ